jgi:membrane protease YdiL (CAAX protease family)
MTADSAAPTNRHRVPRPLTEAIIAYAAFCGLSLLSRFVPPVFFLVVVGGIAFPLLWVARARDWVAIGFTRHKPGQALLWGTGMGLAGMAYILLSSRGDPPPPPPMPGLQLALGIPLALLILSPFQELFFRGWLQPRFECALGRWAGLFITAGAFAFWHLLPPFEGSPTSTVPVASLEGTLTTLGMGLAFGYAFQRTRNIIAPWLAHACMIVGLILVGAMTLVQYTP